MVQPLTFKDPEFFWTWVSAWCSMGRRPTYYLSRNDGKEIQGLQLKHDDGLAQDSTTIV